MSDEHGFSTRAIHAGQEADASTGAVVPPIYQVSTFRQDGIGGFRGRLRVQPIGQPDADRARGVHRGARGRQPGLRLRVRSRRPGLRRPLPPRPGDHVVVPSDAYGGTYRYVNKVARPRGSSTRSRGSATSTPSAPRSSPAARRWSGSRRRPTRSSASPTSRPSPRSPTRPGRSSSSTTRSPPLPAEPHRARRRHRHALDDEVRRRPQ